MICSKSSKHPGEIASVRTENREYSSRVKAWWVWVCHLQGCWWPSVTGRPGRCQRPRRCGSSPWRRWQCHWPAGGPGKIDEWIWRVNLLNPTLVVLLTLGFTSFWQRQTLNSGKPVKILCLSKKNLEVRLTSIQHRGLPAFVPHTIMVSLTFWMTVIKLSHSSCERKGQKRKKQTKGREKRETF